LTADAPRYGRSYAQGCPLGRAIQARLVPKAVPADSVVPTWYPRCYDPHMASNPSAAILIREHGGQPYYDAKFRCAGRQIKRRIGPAWIERDLVTGEWRRKRGRIPENAFDERRAHVAAAQIVAQHVADAADSARVEEERRTRGVTFREVAEAYLQWLETVRGAKPSTMLGHRSALAEPGTPYKRGERKVNGYIMAALGDRPATKITTREIEALLTTIAATEVGSGKDARPVSARTVNKQRQLISAVFNYGAKASTFSLPSNPVRGADKRREAHRAALVYYRVEEVEALARALAAGRHRKPSDLNYSDSEKAAQLAENQQDAEVVRVAAYAGLRLGELLALRWRDIDLQGHALTVERAMSAGIESSTKSGLTRRVPLPDQAAAALDRLGKRDHYTDPHELVFCNVFGRTLDGSALRRRYKRAQTSAGLRPLRWHDLRHTYGSLLAAAGVDLVTIQAVMGHSALATTGRYLHARPADNQAQVFTAAFSGTEGVVPAAVLPVSTTP
jgi:integrase